MINIAHAHAPEGQPRGHPMSWCPSWLVGKELERCVLSVRIMQKNVLGLLKVNVELLLLFLSYMIEVKKRAPGQTPPVIQCVQNFGRLISQ